ncbi:MAG: hypothetical protein Tsb0034_26630 [Ekhidna sp.]
MLRTFIQISFIIFVLEGCQQDVKNHRLEYEIQNSLKENDNPNVLKLDTVSQFQWDTLVLLKPYSSIENLEESLNLDFSNVRGKFQHYDEYLGIAFFNKGKCVSFIELVRNFEVEDQEKILYKKEDSIIKIKM